MPFLRLPLLLLLVALAGCADAHALPDAGSPPRDGAIAECGTPIEASDLAPELAPVFGVCLALEDGPLAAVARDADAFDLFHAHAETVGAVTTISVDRYAGSIAAGTLVRSGVACTTTLTAADPATIVALSSSLGLSPAGERPHFGVRISTPPPDLRILPGRAYVVGDECTFHELEVDHYAGGTMLSEDPAELIVNGSRESNLGLIRGDTEVAPSSGGGDVVRLGEGEVLAAVGSGHGAVQLMLYDAAALRTGPYPVGGIASDFESWPRDFVALEGRRIVGRPVVSSDDDPHLRYEIRVEGDRIPFAEPAFFASSRFTRVVPIAGSARVLLQHEGGVLVVE